MDAQKYNYFWGYNSQSERFETEWFTDAVRWARLHATTEHAVIIYQGPDAAAIVWPVGMDPLLVPEGAGTPVITG